MGKYVWQLWKLWQIVFVGYHMNPSLAMFHLRAPQTKICCPCKQYEVPFINPIYMTIYPLILKHLLLRGIWKVRHCEKINYCLSL